MIKTLISVDLSKSPTEQPTPLHNRWHPDIPAVATVNPGDSFRVECLDWTGGQIKNNDNARDIQDVDLSQVHYLSGPIAVTGAEPGDLLVVDIIDLGPLPGHEWGYTGIFAKQNGGGFLVDYFPDAHKAIWDLKDGYASSRHIPGVTFLGMSHPGTIGVAPSHEMLKVWNKREAELINSAPNRVPPYGWLPEERGALAGSLTGAAAQRVAKEGARTVPGRENGGNTDVVTKTRSSRLYFPVQVKDALLSIGDLHYSQGDGEISFCGGIEMAGWISLKVDIIKQGARMYELNQGIFRKDKHAAPQYPEYLAFEGISVDAAGKQHYLDATIAYQQACLHAINYLKKFGYTGEQIYTLLSAAPVEGRINGIVDAPNAFVSLAVPTGIFDFDIQPNKNGPVSAKRGQICCVK